MNSRLSLAGIILLSFFGGSPFYGAESRAESSKRDISSQNLVRPDTPRTDYVLQPQDVIRVYVAGEDDINKLGDINISGENTISLPFIGTISLKDKTVRQAEAMIQKAYDKDFFVDPQVTLTVLKYAERTVNVIGQVNTPGRVPFPPEKGLTIVDAITFAGGHTRLARLKEVKLTRKNAEGEAVPTTIDVDAIMLKGARDIPLQPDDIIQVPERII